MLLLAEHQHPSTPGITDMARIVVTGAAGFIGTNHPSRSVSMLKKLITLVLMLSAAACFAALDINKASEAELDSIKGLGPSTSSKILDERKKASFKDWNDFISRVKGIGEAKAAKFSTAGVTVNGAAFKPAATAPASQPKKAP